VDEITSCGGQELRGMFNNATRWLEFSAQYINTLNVFPVPDGDTGTNMLLTMRAAMEEAARCIETSASSVASSMAQGSLMGARGNSGVILSQILRGLAAGLDGKSTFNGKDLAVALAESSDAAYSGISKPVEGTILTVIRECAEVACSRNNSHNGSLVSVMEAVVEEARASVARTPSLLPVLRQARVVDAGGQGLFVVLEGLLRYLRGEQSDADITGAAPVLSAADIEHVLPEDAEYGYCTEFLLQGRNLNIEAIRGKLASLGESVIVVGHETTARVHIHTFDPGAVFSHVTSIGSLRQVKVENMDEQHRDFIMSHPDSDSTFISTIAVVSGAGLTEVFYSIGATVVVPGGETMNPSVQDLVQAAELAPSEKIIIIPNNPNILLAAEKAAGLTQKQVAIVPARTIPEGIASLLAFNVALDLEANADAMRKALQTVHTGEVSRAGRTMEVNGFSVVESQAIAFLDGNPVVADDSMMHVIHRLLYLMGIDEGDLVTLYYGADTTGEEVEQVVESIKSKYPSQEVEVLAGGQPHYNYIVTVE